MSTLKKKRNAPQISWRAKLTPQQVRKIRVLYFKKNYTQEELAQQFMLSQTAISNLIRGVTYRGIC
jgi:DNA-binding transcriptional regulator LsrR (DeoR family)